MSKIYEKIKRSSESVRERTGFKPRIGIVLGSGLGGFAEGVKKEAEIAYIEIEGFPVSTVAGHAGKIVFGYVGDVPVVVMQGRVHYYEGYEISDVVLPVRLMKQLGADTLILTNAVGAINESYRAGEFMLITDHIMQGVPSPLIGENIEELGVRFPDMSEVYSKELREKVKEAAQRQGLKLQEGVYLQTSGPNFETPAEIRAYRAMGADVVGMSTACEAVAANHMGMRICGISCISNLAAGISKTPLTHEEVQEMADKTAPRFKDLLSEIIEKI